MGFPPFGEVVAGFVATFLGVFLRVGTGVILIGMPTIGLVVFGAGFIVDGVRRHKRQAAFLSEAAEVIKNEDVWLRDLAEAVEGGANLATWLQDEGLEQLSLRPYLIARHKGRFDGDLAAWLSRRG